MKRILKDMAKIKVYLLICLVFIVVGAFYLSVDKTKLHLTINSFHNPFLDFIFKHGTDLGDGLITAIAVLPIGIFVFKKYRYSTFVLGWLTLFLTGVFAQFMKRVVFPDAERPMKFIGEDLLYLVPSVDVHSMNSFPSGHTATAFAFYAFVSFSVFRNNKLGQLFMALIAVLVGYSRMYLSQHFLEDVVVGALIGLLAYLIAQAVTSSLFKS